MKASPLRICLTSPANHFAAALADSSRKLYVHKVVKGIVSYGYAEDLSHEPRHVWTRRIDIVPIRGG